MLTKKDLQEIEKITKSHLQDSYNDLIKSHIYPLQESQDDLKESFESKMTEFKSEILDAIDAVMGELKAMREEQTLICGRLSNHEERIDRLERKANFASS